MLGREIKFTFKIKGGLDMKVKYLFLSLLIFIFSVAIQAQPILLKEVKTEEGEKDFILELYADSDLNYTLYYDQNGNWVLDLPDLVPSPKIPSEIPSVKLSEPLKIDFLKDKVSIFIPSDKENEPLILKTQKGLKVVLPGSSDKALKKVDIEFEKDLPVVYISGNNLPEPQISFLDNPDRMVLDFPDTLNLNKSSNFFVNQPELTKIKISQFKLKPNPVARVVLYTPLKVKEGIEKIKNGFKISFSKEEIVEAAPVPQAGEGVTVSQFEPKVITKTGVKYTGEPIDLNLKDAPLIDVLNTFAELSGLNFVLDPGVTARVSLRLQAVPWDQALELILKINNLGYVQENNIIRIAPTTKLAQEAQQKRQLEKEEDLNLPIQTIIKRLSYARAEEIQSKVRKVISERGDLFIDERTNTIILMDIEKYIPRALDLIKNLDIPPRQVLIEARIVETTKNFTQQLGIIWGFTGVADTAHGNPTGLKFPYTYNILGDVALPKGETILDATFGNILGSFNLDLALTAAESEGLVKIISSPRVITQDNLPAKIQSGVQIPVQTTANNTYTVTYIDATLMLQVTPQITEAGTISMQVDVKKREPLTALMVTGGTNAPISTREAQTRIMVKDGGTTVIGGIYQITDNKSQDRIPFLHKIPILGNAFKNKNYSKRHDELLIFITPRIVQNL